MTDKLILLKAPQTILYAMRTKGGFMKVTELSERSLFGISRFKVVLSEGQQSYDASGK